MNRLSKAQEQHRMHLYREGLTDREIAERCGVGKGAIHKWRTKRGLPAANTKYLNAGID